MDTDIRERIEEEMTKCNSLRLYKNRVKKINNKLPDEVVENILSFVQCSCKKCVRTRKVIEKTNILLLSLFVISGMGLILKKKCSAKNMTNIFKMGWECGYITLYG